MNNIAPPEVTGKFAGALEDLARARKYRLDGDIVDAYILESRAEKALFSALSAAGCTRHGDTILTEWEGSLAQHPLELPSVQALIYTPSAVPVTWTPVSNAEVMDSLAGEGARWHKAGWGPDPDYPEVFGEWGEVDRDG